MKNPYDRFKDGKLKESRVKEGYFKSPLDDDIIEIYERLLDEEDFANAYREMSQSIGRLKPSSVDIGTFAKRLPYYEERGDYDWKSGIFLTELVNNMEEEEIFIDFSLMGRKIDHLGYLMKDKRVVVNGNVGSCLGMGMSSGEIIVHGDAGRFVGHEMKGGKITVNGKAESAGSSMEGGVIEIREAEEPNSWKAWKNRGEVYVAGERIW